MTTHVLFDFFGTLVGYSPERCDRGYPRTRAALDELGLAMSADELTAAWEETWYPSSRSAASTTIGSSR